jgi:uncharacterized protein YbcC (UPF0753/DUF2309 family)
VLLALKQSKNEEPPPAEKSFQVTFCIDDRETSLRDYLEKTDPACATYSTPGFFGVEFYFQPEHGKSYTKQCPAPVTPKYLIKELDTHSDRKKDFHFTRHTHSLLIGWLIAQTIGFWSAIRLLITIFRPALSPATSASFTHMDPHSKLTIEHRGKFENDLQIGFTIDEMVVRLAAVINSIGLIDNFAHLVYFIGHGSTSANNPHYAAYNCGACCGRPGSVNGRVFAYMANHPEVRAKLALKKIVIPHSTQFVGGLHDTARDEVFFYDENQLTAENATHHTRNKQVFKQALDLNARERSRRFALVNTRASLPRIHRNILKRSVSLFEPRPELNHATNALCIIGRREMTKNIFLDRRAFTNSYDYRIDPEGSYLTGIMGPIGPVCGGINLEYYFSRVDNHKLGAGTKLPHNVMGLFGVANGFDGDLRPGLPSQMIEVHDPLRLLVVVEHFPEVLHKVIKSSPAVYEWYINKWIHLVALEPVTGTLHYFKEGSFVPYEPIPKSLPVAEDLTNIILSTEENIPVYLTSQNV